MGTIFNIKFDSKTYFDTDSGILLLYQSSNSESVFISKPERLAFAQQFGDTSICQQYISTNDQKQFILFAYSDDMVSWLKSRTKIPDNLTKIIIFCAPSEDKHYLQRWIRRYSDKIKKIVTFTQLEYELLVCGIEYIQNLFQRFKKDEKLSLLLDENYQQLRSALLNYFDSNIEH